MRPVIKAHYKKPIGPYVDVDPGYGVTIRLHYNTIEDMQHDLHYACLNMPRPKRELSISTDQLLLYLARANPRLVEDRREPFDYTT